MLSMVSLVLSTMSASLWINLLSILLGGAGYSLLFVGGLEVASAAAPAEHRGGVLSAAYLFGYLSMSSVAIALGGVASLRGLDVAIFVGAALVTAFALPVALIALGGPHLRNRRRQ